MSEIITVPESYKTYKPKKFDRWDSFVEQFRKDHPEMKDKLKNPSAKKKKKRNKNDV